MSPEDAEVPYTPWPQASGTQRWNEVSARAAITETSSQTHLQYTQCFSRRDYTQVFVWIDVGRRLGCVMSLFHLRVACSHTSNRCSPSSKPMTCHSGRQASKLSIQERSAGSNEEADNGNFEGMGTLWAARL